MDAVVYPNEEVKDFVAREVIPLKLASDEKPYCDDFNVQWTPALIVLDTDGKERHRTVGFMSPEELIPSLLLGIGKSLFENGEFVEASARLEELIAEYAKSAAAPEAIFFRGVADYKGSGDPTPLKEAYEKLILEYPESEWAKRAYPYRLIG
ncbi:tetratricopeptide repeat protein [Thermodesulfobacteriota bacterium]